MTGREQEEIRERVDIGEWDWRELEQWRENEDVSVIQFESPWRDA